MKKKTDKGLFFVMSTKGGITVLMCPFLCMS